MILEKEHINFSKPHRNLGLIFATTVMFIMMLGIGALAGFQYYSDLNNAKQELTNTGQSIANLIAEISIEPLLTYDYVLLDSIVRDANKQTHIAYIALETSDGIIVSLKHNSKLSLLESNAPSKNTLYKLKNIPHLIQVRATISHEKNLGIIYIGLNGSHLKQVIIYDFIESVIFSTFATFITAVLIYLFFRNQVYVRIVELANIAQTISHLDFTQKIKTRGNDELTIVGNLFNTMTQQLQTSIEERDRAIQETLELNHSLEQRVEKRSEKLKQLNVQLSHQAMHDPLTNLPNRLLASERLQAAISMARRHKTSVSVFMIDLNKFKEINDTLGHHVGDLVLEEVSIRFPEALREEDTIARVGGDEFIIILPETGNEGAEIVANKIKQQLESPIMVGDSRLIISASIGISIFPNHGKDESTLIRQADIAMYTAKTDNSYFAFYNPDEDTHSRDRLTLMADLRDAIENNNLLLYYQPLVDLTTKKMIGVEALSRWHHETIGWVPPDEFISIAEHSGLIKPLTEWLLRTACLQAKKWDDEGLNTTISINLSARNMLDPEIPSTFSHLLKKYNLKSNRFKFEITESTLMHSPERVHDMMTCSQFFGVEYSIDDFGTGYSSLNYLKKLPVDNLKIDRSFIMDMVDDSDDRIIVQSTIRLAHGLGLKVIAEGVENQQIIDILNDMKCDIGQGYFYSKAVPANEIKALKESIDNNTNDQA